MNSKCCVANLLEKNPFSVFKFVCLSLPSISRTPTKVAILNLGDIVHDSRRLSPVPKLGTDLSKVLLRAAGPGIWDRTSPSWTQWVSTSARLWGSFGPINVLTKTFLFYSLLYRYLPFPSFPALSPSFWTFLSSLQDVLSPQSFFRLPLYLTLCNFCKGAESEMKWD